jgi:hypothetical protein
VDFRQAIAAMPDRDRAVSAWKDMGWSLQQLGRYEEAGGLGITLRGVVFCDGSCSGRRSDRMIEIEPGCVAENAVQKRHISWSEYDPPRKRMTPGPEASLRITTRG